MRIAILASTRFHMVDLARELAARGHEVRVYSLVPPYMTRKFGLPAECNRWLAPYVAPLFALSRMVRRGRLSQLANYGLLSTLDLAASFAIERCDVLIGLSGLTVRSLDAVKSKYGAITFLERGSRHILSQKEILDAQLGADKVHASDLPRELAGYAKADFVSVPATHVVDSFVERGFPREKLFMNSYGASLDVFTPTARLKPDAPKTIIMTGTWCSRKGCDTLLDAWRMLPGVRLLHVGPVGDLPLPNDVGFEHVASVAQHRLREFYERADVFALASREEGLAVVQVQALACGLKLVCTTRTGGADLQRPGMVPGSITVVPPDDPGRFAAALRAALHERDEREPLRDRLGDARAEYSWSAYAARYEAKLEEALESKRSGRLGSSSARAAL